MEEEEAAEQGVPEEEQGRGQEEGQQWGEKNDYHLSESGAMRLRKWYSFGKVFR